MPLTVDQSLAILGQEILENPGYVRSLAESNGYWNTDVARLELQDFKAQAIQAESMQLLEIDDFEMLQFPYFNQRNKVHEENIDYYKGFQWTEADKKKIIEQHRKPYVSNQLRRFVQTLLGEQVGSATDWHAVGEDQEAQSKAELLNHILRWVAQRNRWERVESMVFRDGVIGGLGVAQVRLDPNNPAGNIILERHRPQEFMWDIESACLPSLQDSRYLWRGYYIQKEHLALEFPEWYDEIMEGIGGMATGRRWDTYYAYKRPKVREAEGELFGLTTHDPQMQRGFRNYVFKREFYRRRYIKKWRIIDGHAGQEIDFDSPDDAIVEAKKRWQFYMQKQIPQRMGLAQPLISEPQPVNLPVIDQMILAGDRLLRVNQGDRDRYPYKFYAPEWYDGDLTSYFEHGKDEQRFRNNIISYFDLIARGTKGITLVNRAKLSGDWTDQQIMDEAQKPNQIWVLDDPSAESLQGIVQHVDPPQLNTALPQTMYSILGDNLSTSFGGPNTIGQEAFAGQSGRNAEVLRSSANLAVIPLMNEFRYFKQEIGEDICYLAQFLDPYLRMMVADGDNNPEFMSVIESGVQSIEGLKYQIVIEEVTASPTERDARMSRLMALAGQMPELAQDMAEVFLEYSDVDESDRKRIIASRDARLQQQSDLEERQMAMNEMAQKAKIQSAILDKLIKLKELDIMSKRPPAITMSLKPDASPALVSEVLNAAGIPADPLGVAQSQAFGDQMQRENLTLQQINRNKNLLPEEREGLKNKAKQAYRNPAKKVEDSSARKDK